MRDAVVDRPPAPADPAPGAPTRRRRAGRLLVGLVGVAALAVVGAVAAWFVLPRLLAGEPYHGTTFPQADPAPPLDGLVTAAGEPVDLADYRGEPVVLFFGYTSCPDVCPITLAGLERASEQLSGEAVHVLFVGVDTARDTPEVLARYVANFGEPDGEGTTFVGVTGSPDAIADAAARYGVFYALGEPDADGQYTVDHTASLIGIDAEGDLRVVWSADTTPEDLAADLRHLD